MTARRELNLLVVHGDGRRIARLTLPRWLILTVLGLFLAVLASVTVIYEDYLRLRSQRASQQPTETKSMYHRSKILRKTGGLWVSFLAFSRPH